MASLWSWSQASPGQRPPFSPVKHLATTVSKKKGIRPAAALWTVTAAAAENVDIPDGAVTLHAALYRPDGAGPFPAIVALHDCGGLDSRPAATTELYGEWAKLLVADGFVVLFPDSFGSRGLGSQCRVRRPTVDSSNARGDDARAARQSGSHRMDR